MQGFTVVDLVILIVYLAAVLFVGLHFAKKKMNGKEYFKGDGTVPWWVTSVSIFATLAFIAASGVMVYIKYFVPADKVSIWSYSIISIAVSLVVGILASIIWRKVKGDTSKPAAFTTIYKN